MIESYDEYRFYLRCDEIAIIGRKPKFHEKILGGIRYSRILRRQELVLNTYKGFGSKLLNTFFKWRKSCLGRKTGWYIPPNTFGPGLCIVHYGPVIVNPNCRFGCNCRIQAMVNIGAGKDKNSSPHGGNNIYFGPGCKLYGNIEIGNYVAIGANAVVNKSFDQDNITIAGVPARIVSYKGAKGMMIDAVDYI